MPKPSMTVVWERIAAHTGEQFKTKTGLPFSYSIHGNTLTTTRTDYPLARSEFEQLLKEAPLNGPGRVSDTVRGSAYVWAILHDKRVRGSDW